MCTPEPLHCIFWHQCVNNFFLYETQLKLLFFIESNNHSNQVHSHRLYDHFNTFEFFVFLKILCPKRSSKFRISGNKYSIPKLFFHALLKPHIHLIIIQTNYIPRDFRIFLVHSNFPFCLKFFALNQVLNVEFSATSTRFRNFSYML